MSDDIREKFGSTPPKQEYLRTRNDPLNIHLGGGLLVGCINEIFGDADMFKTTFLAENIADVLANDGWAIVHDREDRLTHERIRLVGGDPDHPRLVYRSNNPYTLTIEDAFMHAARTLFSIRTLELEEVVKALLSKKPPEKLRLRYARRIGAPSPEKARAADVAKALIHTVNGERIVNTHLLLPEDMRLILWVLDSVTALPPLTAIADKAAVEKAHTNRDLSERSIRTGEDGSGAIGQGAQRWSSSFRDAAFVDARVCGLFSAQTRLHGLTSGNPYKDAAEPGALKFYTRTRIQVYPMENPVIYADVETGNLFFTATPTSAQKEMAVGKRIWMHVKKTAACGSFRVPAFMLGRTGTDRCNTVWEFMVDRGIFKHMSSGRYAVTAPIPAGEEPIEMLTRAEFITRLYTERLQLWASIITARAACGAVTL